MPTAVLYWWNMDSRLHSQGKRESNIHLHAPAIYRTPRAITNNLGSSAGNSTHKQPTHTPDTKLCTLFLLGNRKTTCIHQTVYWIICECLFVYILVSNYFSHTSSNWNRGGLMGYGMHCMYWGLNFPYGKITYISRKGFFILQSTVLAVKRVKIVSDRMSHIVMRVCRWDFVLIVNVQTANINYYSKVNFHEEFEQVFNHLPTYHMHILLGCCKAKYGREDRFKLTAGKYHSLHITNPWENVKM
jgi:hypothetical protein